MGQLLTEVRAMEVLVFPTQTEPPAWQCDNCQCTPNNERDGEPASDPDLEAAERGMEVEQYKEMTRMKLYVFKLHCNGELLTSLGGKSYSSRQLFS